MGTLRITGVIELEQFWPIYYSDADTTKIKLTVDDDSFKYKATRATTFIKTNVFKEAVSKGTISTSVIKKNKKDGLQTIIVRLEGVDAPELHYKATPLKNSPDITVTQKTAFNKLNVDRRQCFAESATIALCNYLKKFTDNGMVKVVFKSEVDKPFEVVDTYGRFIENILVNGNKDISIWLVENGWCSPAFYTSMLNEEIDIFLRPWEKGKKVKGKTNKSISKVAYTFNWDMLYRKPGTIQNFIIGEDK